MSFFRRHLPFTTACKVNDLEFSKQGTDAWAWLRDVTGQNEFIRRHCEDEWFVILKVTQIYRLQMRIVSGGKSIAAANTHIVADSHKNHFISSKLTQPSITSQWDLLTKSKQELYLIQYPGTPPCLIQHKLFYIICWTSALLFISLTSSIDQIKRLVFQNH